MTYQEIYTMLQGIGLPVTYYQWPEDHAPEPPYLVFYYPGDNDFKADDRNFVKIRELVVELYTDEKDVALEETVEAALSGMVYERDETYIDSERMFEVAYTMEVVING